MKRTVSLSLRSICRWMMENGQYPKYEKTHILFAIDDNMAVLEYKEGVLSVRIFFSIEEDLRDLFLEASNSMMMESSAVKPVILDDNSNIMFSCETLCYTRSDLKRFLPHVTELLRDAIAVHKAEMKRLVLADGMAGVMALPSEDSFNIQVSKPVS